MQISYFLTVITLTIKVISASAEMSAKHEETPTKMTKTDEVMECEEWRRMVNTVLYSLLFLFGLIVTLGLGPFFLLMGVFFSPAIRRTDQAFAARGRTIPATHVKEESDGPPNTVWRTYQICKTLRTPDGKEQERVYQRKEPVILDPSEDGNGAGKAPQLLNNPEKQEEIDSAVVDCLYLPELGMASTRLPQDKNAEHKYDLHHILLGIAGWIMSAAILFHVLERSSLLEGKDGLLLILSFGEPFASGICFFLSTGNGQRVLKRQLVQNDLWYPICLKHANELPSSL